MVIREKTCGYVATALAVIVGGYLLPWYLSIPIGLFLAIGLLGTWKGWGQKNEEERHYELIKSRAAKTE